MNIVVSPVRSKNLKLPALYQHSSSILKFVTNPITQAINVAIHSIFEES